MRITLAIVVLVLAAGIASGQTPVDWRGHPALAPYDVAPGQLPAALYLVRGPRELPDVPGLTVHGEHAHVYLVSGDAGELDGLARRGFGVYPLRPLRPAVPPLYRSPGPQRPPFATPHPDIAAMVSQVDWTGVRAWIQWLCDFGTRYSYAPNHHDVAGAIAGVFDGLGLETNIRPFSYDGTTMYNVIGTHRGTVYPYSLFVICGHFDSISEDPYVSAPGADDNGTGVAAVLTAAEILSQYPFEYSVRFICFGGEEQGLRGSADYAAFAANVGMNILGVLNFDMMGYWEPGVEKDLEIETNVASRWLADVIINCADVYTDAAYELHVNDRAWWGDHASFWAEGYHAVNHEESYDWYDPDFNPYYHTTNDVLAYVGDDFTVGNIQIGVAALATLAGPVPGTAVYRGPPPEPEGDAAVWMGTGPLPPAYVIRVKGLLGESAARVGVYDIRGRRVAEVGVALDGGAGEQSWRGRSDAGTFVPSGVYFLRLEDFPRVRAAKFVFLK